MRTHIDSVANESFVQPEIAAPPLSSRQAWNNFKVPQHWEHKSPDFYTEKVEAKAPEPALSFGARSKANDADHLLIRGNDQLEAISKNLDAVPLNKIISGDLVVLAGRPGRREQWGIVTAGQNGELAVHHTDSHYWSKTPLSELTKGSRLKEAYRPKVVPLV
jgi:hypothetical protein